MDWLEEVQAVLPVVMAILVLAYVARHFVGKHRARGESPIVARVRSVERREADGSGAHRAYSYEVDTVYEVPNRGVLTHWRGFDTEPQAILFSRLHKEGSSHPVVPNDLEPGKVFLAEELHRGDNYWYAMALLGAFLLVMSLVQYFTP